MKTAPELQFCPVGDHRLAYRRAGAGPRVLLVHGITTYSFIWDEVLAGLAYDHDVIAVDLLGCGASDKPLDVSYALTDHAVRLVKFIRTLGLQPLHLVGHDLGGGIAQILAVGQPDLLEDLALLNTVGHDFWPVQPITALRTPIVRQLLMAALDKGLFRQIVRKGLFFEDKLTEDLMDRFLDPLQTPAGRKAFLHLARCLDNHNLTELEEDLRRLELPTLIMRGEDDPFLNAAISEKLAADIPDSTLVRVPQAGHFIQIDQPDLVVASLRKFWSDHGG